jgi:hypothetical protein
MSNASTIKYSSGAGVDWAALIAGLGLGLTVAMQVTTMTYTDISSVYALITSFSRLCALVGTYFAILGIFLIARIPFVERGVGHDRLTTALMVAGKDGAKWFGLPELASYSAWAVNRNENTAWSVND